MLESILGKENYELAKKYRKPIIIETFDTECNIIKFLNLLNYFYF